MSKVTLKRCPDYDSETVYRSVAGSIELLGGISSFIKSGDRVLLKPNLLSAKSIDTAVTTHPSVIEALIRIVKDAGASPSIGDSPGIGTAGQVAAKTGLKEIAERHGVEIINLSEGIEVENKDGKVFKRFEVSRRAMEADAVINIPKLKTHAMMTMTLGVKNIFGCVPGKRKVSWHFEAGHSMEIFARMLVELYRIVNPRLTIIDGVIGMEGDGPGSGTPRKMGLIAASPDAVALDMIVGRMVGLEYDGLPTTVAARELGSGITDPRKVELMGDGQDMVFEDFKLPRSVAPSFVAGMPGFIKRYLDKALTSRPVIDHELCEKCKICVKACPTHVMAITDKLRINYDDCIHCYCCLELCPEGAIGIKKGWATRLLR